MKTRCMASRLARNETLILSNRWTRILLLAVFGMLFGTPYAVALNQTYYVDNSSSGANLGTQADPFHTITQSLIVLDRGDTVIVVGDSEVSPRLYSERLDFGLTSNSGTVAEPITLRAEPRRSAIIYGAETDGIDNLVLESFQITIPEALIDIEPNAQYALYIRSDNATIRDNFFFDVPGVGIRSDNDIPYHTGGHIVGNHLFRCGMGMVLFADDWLVEENEIERLVQNPTIGFDADYTRGFGSDITFRKNYFHGTQEAEIGGSHTDGFQSFALDGKILHRFTFESNIVTDMDQGVILESQDGLGAVDTIVIRNNVFDSGGFNGAYAVLGKWELTNLTISHNLISNMNLHGVFMRFGAGAIITNNIFYNAGANYHADIESCIGGGYNIINEESYPYYSHSTDIVGVDPGFLNTNNWVGDDGIPFTSDDGYRLVLGSPAIDAAYDVGVTLDLFDTPRPQQSGGGFDIGPHEYPSSAPPPSGGPALAPPSECIRVVSAATPVTVALSVLLVLLLATSTRRLARTR